MHQQVRVTTNGRGKVGIGFITQTEMAEVFHLVHRLAQTAQHDGLDHVAVRAVFELLHQGLVIQRGRGITAG